MAEEMEKKEVNEESAEVVKDESTDSTTDTAVTEDAPAPEESQKEDKVSSGKKIKNTMADIENMLYEEQNNNSKFPEFNVGDTVKVYVKIKEGAKERVQPYEGVVIAIRHGANRKSFIVRRISYEVAVERVFPMHSPYIEDIKVIRRGRVRRAKLYYLRGRFGKKARLREKVNIKKK